MVNIYNIIVKLEEVVSMCDVDVFYGLFDLKAQFFCDKIN